MNVAVSHSIQEMKMHAMLIALTANHSNLRIATYLMFRNELEAFSKDMLSMATRKKHSKWSYVVRMTNLIQQIQGINPSNQYAVHIYIIHLKCVGVSIEREREKVNYILLFEHNLHETKNGMNISFHITEYIL